MTSGGGPRRIEQGRLGQQNVGVLRVESGGDIGLGRGDLGSGTPRCTVPARATSGLLQGTGPERMNDTLHAPSPNRNRSSARSYVRGSRPAASRISDGGATSRSTVGTPLSSESESIVWSVTIFPPWARRSWAIESAIDCDPPSGMGQPPACASAPRARPAPAEGREGRVPTGWAATPVKSAAATSVLNRRFHRWVP